MPPRSRAVTATGLAFALCAAATAGCQSQWYMTVEHAEVVRTDVVVRTEPTGATVSFDGRVQDAAPLRIPVDYEHSTQQWERQTNAGARMRESTGVIGTILLFPIWLPASFFHSREEMKRHVYGLNRHVVSAQMQGYEAAEQQIELEGEAQVEVSLKLTR
ncbi:MAG: hypothetical protein K8T90_10870 [Planctomycetes bacterium]|nr:hypothetical protein [Planctomycetota bacterium]